MKRQGILARSGDSSLNSESLGFLPSIACKLCELSYICPLFQRAAAQHHCEVSPLKNISLDLLGSCIGYLGQKVEFFSSQWDYENFKMHLNSRISLGELSEGKSFCNKQEAVRAL